ncbi:CpaF family protein [Fimbriiglobus ruber]|uniref:Type II/IV secretion system ATP hydrolase TadA/VirB11/CpaF, TadA subfamily n=1 Tax=Fimbriiglobus ruber TaxID=1908690 RepID=A0A225D173_9BACT|nr:CpaF family protein [Fimbriiglobus ruber]OWK35262.1 Type II/IV secretion system ATP hydrolase TadA/VirB11/CpaF, TadA subfamily [Fimbriiglobus ruber]
MPDDRPVAAQTANTFAARYHQLKTETHRRVVETLDLSKLNRWDPVRLKREVRAMASQLCASAPELLNEVEREQLTEEVMSEVFGLGPLDKLMADPEVSDVLVNGPHSVYIERGGRLELTSVRFHDDAHLLQLVQRIAARVGRRADESSPMVDARLADGSRVNAIIPPLALTGPVLSIRRFGIRLGGDDLLANRTMPTEFLDFLRAAVEARVSILVSGGTGSGKTTLLNALSQYIPAHERLITIEDSAELKLRQPHVVALETRTASVEGTGEVRQRELVRNALRMRPDRIIVGEVRGGEALDMLQAMNTGHEGSLTTIHANDTRDALARLEMMVMMAGYELPVPVIRYYIATAITLVVQLSRLTGGKRRMIRVSEVRGVRDGRVALKDVFGYRQLGVRDGVAFGEFYSTGYRPRVLEKLTAMGVELPEETFTEGTVFDD